ncbi:MAG TPA: hypothetical protein VFA32_24515 [Dehalococcoidia bacterium]|nr:hypothetical protein [Dehalococcoidia bacterium]
MRVDYFEYLCSRDWAVKRRQVKERSGGVCERCRNAPVQDVHHRSYRNLGNEPLEELQGLCRPCHGFISAKSDFDPLHRCERCSAALQPGGEMCCPTCLEKVRAANLSFPMGTEAGLSPDTQERITQWGWPPPSLHCCLCGDGRVRLLGGNGGELTSVCHRGHEFKLCFNTQADTTLRRLATGPSDRCVNNWKHHSWSTSWPRMTATWPSTGHPCR